MCTHNTDPFSPYSASIEWIKHNDGVLNDARPNRDMFVRVCVSSHAHGSTLVQPHTEIELIEKVH